jgi:pyridoxamine 5'-phosphate oxidase family protein
MFSKPEVEYFKSQRLARFSTVAANGQPDVVPVGLEFDGKKYFYVGSHSQDILPRTRKYKNVKAGKSKVAFVVDDLVSVDPWRVRGIKVFGTAEIVRHEGMFGPGEYLRITPKVSWSWGIEGLNLKKDEWVLKTVHS